MGFHFLADLFLRYLVFLHFLDTLGLLIGFLDLVELWTDHKMGARSQLFAWLMRSCHFLFEDLLLILACSVTTSKKRIETLSYWNIFVVRGIMSRSNLNQALS